MDERNIGILNLPLIRQRLKERRVTQKALALAIGTSPQHMGRILAEQQAPSIGLLRRLADVLDLSVDALLSRGALQQRPNGDAAHV